MFSQISQSFQTLSQIDLFDLLLGSITGTTTPEIGCDGSKEMNAHSSENQNDSYNLLIYIIYNY